MRKIFLLCLTLGTVFAVYACGGKGDPVDHGNTSGCLAGAPTWVIEGGAEGGLTSVGAAVITDAGFNFARNMALANGRDELARTMEVKVNNMIKDFTQTTGIGDVASVDKVSSQVSKQLASQTIQGSVQKNLWISQCDELYVLVGIDDDAVFAEELSKQAISSYKDDEALWQQFQAAKAQDELDMAIQNEFGGGR